MIRYLGGADADIIDNLNLAPGAAGRISRALWHNGLIPVLENRSANRCRISDIAHAINTIGPERMLRYPNLGKTTLAQLLIALRKCCEDVPTPSYVTAYEHRDQRGMYRKIWVPAEHVAAFDRYVKKWR